MSDDGLNSTDPSNLLRVDFRLPRDPSAPDLAVRRRRSALAKPACDHLQVEIDERDHSVTCRACESPVDPFFVLKRLARLEMSLFWNREEIVKMREEREKLKEEERRIKARIRTALAREDRLSCVSDP